MEICNSKRNRFSGKQWKNNFKHQKSKLILNNPSEREAIEKLQHDKPIVYPLYVKKIFATVPF